MDATSKGPMASIDRAPHPSARRRFQAGFFWALTCMTAIACVSLAQATTVKRMAFSEVIGDAAVIAAAEVVAIDSVWDAERGIPYTEVVFLGDRPLKGEIGAGQELRLRFQGGTAPNGLTLKVSGMPAFRLYQRVVLFSAGGIDDQRACPLVGWWQGLYRLRPGGDGLSVTDHAGRAVVGIDDVDGKRVARLADAGETGTRALTLEAFASAILQGAPRQRALRAWFAPESLSSHVCCS